MITLHSRKQKCKKTKESKSHPHCPWGSHCPCVWCFLSDVAHICPDVYLFSTKMWTDGVPAYIISCDVFHTFMCTFHSCFWEPWGPASRYPDTCQISPDSKRLASLRPLQMGKLMSWELKQTCQSPQIQQQSQNHWKPGLSPNPMSHIRPALAVDLPTGTEPSFIGQSLVTVHLECCQVFHCYKHCGTKYFDVFFVWLFS